MYLAAPWTVRAVVSQEKVAELSSGLGGFSGWSLWFLCPWVAFLCLGVGQNGTTCVLAMALQHFQGVPCLVQCASSDPSQ